MILYLLVWIYVYIKIEDTDRYSTNQKWMQFNQLMVFNTKNKARRYQKLIKLP